MLHTVVCGAQRSTKHHDCASCAAAASTQGLDRDMFMLVWGPTVAAVSVVLDHADNPVIVSTALEGLMHAARIAAYHHIDEVLNFGPKMCNACCPY